MRTTLTLDDDVALLLKKEIRRSGEPFKQAVNRHLRSALTSRSSQPAPKPFTVRTFSMQFPEGVNLDKTSAALEALEGPLHR